MRQTHVIDWKPPSKSPEETIRLLEQELANTSRDVRLLIIELEKRVADLEEANRSLRRHAELISLSADAIITTDAAGRITAWNRGAEEMYGWTEAEAIGQIAYELLQTRAAVPREEIEESLCRKLRWSGEVTQIRRDKRVLTVDSRRALLRDEAGAPIGMIQINRDLTERERLEEQLRQSQKLESIGQLAGGVAHDFNNLLTIITGYADMMLLDWHLSDPLREPVEEIALAAARAAALTRQLLAFSRRQPAEPVNLVLNDAVRNIEKMLRRLIGADIRLVLSFEPSEAIIRADAGHIEQVIMNLAVNARDAMPFGGTLAIETRRVTLGEDFARMHFDTPPGDYLMLLVSDTGTGMAPEVKAHIFEPFFTTKEKGKGTGLGLSTVYGIVRQSRGWIEVDSQPGLGTTFRILFPIITAETQPARKAETQPARKAETDRDFSGSETVLLVEDEPAVRRYVRQVLEQRGYRVLEADQGADAIEILRRGERAVDLLIADIVMPELGGLAVADEFERLHPGAPVLYMSGYSERLWRRDQRIRFLQKPFAPAALLKEVRELLDGRAESQSL